MQDDFINIYEYNANNDIDKENEIWEGTIYIDMHNFQLANKTADFILKNKEIGKRHYKNIVGYAWGKKIY